MDDEKFLRTIYKVAEELLGRRLLRSERKDLVERFNQLRGNPFERAKDAIMKITGRDIPETFLLLESEGALNELANLVMELERTANEWMKNE